VARGNSRTFIIFAQTFSITSLPEEAWLTRGCVNTWLPRGCPTHKRRALWQKWFGSQN
jgi:hypothetical protein